MVALHRYSSWLTRYNSSGSEEICTRINIYTKYWNTRKHARIYTEHCKDKQQAKPVQKNYDLSSTTAQVEPELYKALPILSSATFKGPTFA